METHNLPPHTHTHKHTNNRSYRQAYRRGPRVDLVCSRLMEKADGALTATITAESVPDRGVQLQCRKEEDEEEEEEEEAVCACVCMCVGCQRCRALPCAPLW